MDGLYTHLKVYAHTESCEVNLEKLSDSPSVIILSSSLLQPHSTFLGVHLQVKDFDFSSFNLAG